ncbi:aldo/keto reductase [soil metagenome]
MLFSFIQNLIMEYIKLPNSDLKVSRIAFGAWPIVGGFNWGPQDDKDSKAALSAAFEAGINFFDTAEAYGDGKSEKLIAEVLNAWRDKIIIATKVSPQSFKYEDLKNACENRLKLLKTEYVDMLQLHWPNKQVPVQETIQALEDLKSEGKILSYGLSNFGKNDLEEAMTSGARPASNQLPYNLIWRAVEFEIIPACQKYNIPLLCYMPIMQGMLAGKFKNADEVPEDRARTRHFSSKRPQTRHKEAGLEEETFDTLDKIRLLAEEINVSMADLSMAWLLAQPGVASIIVGARNENQVKRNVKAIHTSLSPGVIQKLNEITEPLKEKLGKNADMWQGSDESRIK